jgi:2',3'-cyclic-nucleotide 2'-phosphodiesterase (5'-nucleotidase family)|uniref:Bifunctional metallophosphatase/5'-nucleotidase n=1 Tax=candidate division WOR-3 bacterium TaxID=2052148 RepID=A0A7V3VUQ4_UNCW3
MSLFLIYFLLNTVPEHIYILYTNDIEGSLLPSNAWWINPYFPPPVGNAPAAATLIKEKRREADSLGYGFLLLDTGDMFVGSPISEFSHGMAVADYFNYCGYDLLSPGNHDFDMGIEVLKEFIKSVKAQFICSNIVYENTKTNVEYFRPYTIIEFGELKIGVFALITEYMLGMTTLERFKNQSVLPEIEAARRYVDTLKSKGVDLIFAMTGIGLRHDKRLAENVPGIDVIFGSHSSTALEEPYEDSINHTIICQNYSHLTSIGFLDLIIDRKTRRIKNYTGELIDLLSDEIELDTVLLNILNKWEQTVKEGFDEVIGYAKNDLTRAGFEESPMGNLITDAMREYFNADIAIHNSGGIRANLKKGEITYRDCYYVDALSNTAVLMKMTGEQVIKALEVGVNGHHAIFQVSGIRFKYNSKKPINERVIEVNLEDGTPLDPKKDYLVVTNSFLAGGSGDYAIFKEGKDTQYTFTYLRNIIADYIKKHSPIDKQIEGRIIDVASK